MRNDMDRVLVTRPRFSWLWARSTFVLQIRNPSLREESAACGIGGDGGMAPNTARTNPRAGASTPDSHGRVSVNGSAPLGGEIFNEWNCRSISLREGRHDMELYAVNGTGYKGNCSHIDGNTGELRVTGEDSQTQSWRHRGGKGSKANIEVTVR